MSGPRNELKETPILFFGDTGSGKTHFVKSLEASQGGASFTSKDLKATIGVEEANVKYNDQPYRIYDAAGREKFGSISKSYVRKSNEFVCFIDPSKEIPEHVINILKEIPNGAILHVKFSREDLESNKEQKNIEPMKKKLNEIIKDRLSIQYHENPTMKPQELLKSIYEERRKMEKSPAAVKEYQETVDNAITSMLSSLKEFKPKTGITGLFSKKDQQQLIATELKTLIESERKQLSGNNYQNALDVCSTIEYIAKSFTFGKKKDAPILPLYDSIEEHLNTLKTNLNKLNDAGFYTSEAVAAKPPAKTS